MSGIQVRVGFGWKTDAFPNNSLYNEERMNAMKGSLGGARRQVANKEFTVEDFFPNKPQPAVSLKQFKDNLKLKLHHLSNNESLNHKFIEKVVKLKSEKREISKKAYNE